MRWLDLYENPIVQDDSAKEVIEQGIEAEEKLKVFKMRSKISLGDISAFLDFRIEFMKMLHKVLSFVRKFGTPDSEPVKAAIVDLQSLEDQLVAMEGTTAIDAADGQKPGEMLNQAQLMEKVLYSMFLGSFDVALKNSVRKYPALVTRELFQRGGLIPRFKSLKKISEEGKGA